MLPVIPIVVVDIDERRSSYDGRRPGGDLRSDSVMIHTTQRARQRGCTNRTTTWRRRWPYPGEPKRSSEVHFKLPFSGHPPLSCNGQFAPLGYETRS